ncbi:MAG: hypothetical protein QOE70_150 [Chthoniobacter sp.]|jgi:membrane protein DedA with SNARE-associated domain|nr:hypothetical protein [Chthoniobacter sp.]
MEQFLIQYGLIAVFCCALLENDITFILTGVMIQLGLLDPILGVVYGVSGALVHDTLWFWVGRWKSEDIRRSRVYRRVGPLVEKLASRFGPWELFFCRFLYGTRTPSLVFWGMQGLSTPKFLAIEVLAFSLWASFLAAVGYLLSDAATAVIGRVKNLDRWLFGALVMVAAWVLAARYLTRYEIRKRLPPPVDGA